MMTIERARGRGRMIAVLVAGAALACSENNNGLTTVNPVPSNRVVVGAAEVTFTELTHTDASARLVLASSLTKLQRLDAAHDTTSDVSVVSLGLVAVSDFTFTPAGSAPVRFIRATFGLRNIRNATPLFDPARDNLTFVAVSTPGTVPGTPVRVVLRANGTPADSAIARHLAATDVEAVTAGGAVATFPPSVHVVLSDSVLAATPLPSDAIHLLPFGFVVRGFAEFNGQVRTATPFDGLVTFAFLLPKEAVATDDASTLSLLFVLVNDKNASGPP
jgi:hypothetical protein